MSARQLGKTQALEKQLQEVEGHPRSINIKQTPTFTQHRIQWQMENTLSASRLKRTQIYKTSNTTMEDC